MEHSADEAPYWLADWVYEWEPHVGLPDGHPGLKPADGSVARPGIATWLPELPAAPSYHGSGEI